MKEAPQVSDGSVNPVAPSGKKSAVLKAGQREEIIRRVLAGERAARLCEEYGVSKSYVSLLKQQAKDPGRFQKKKEAKLSRKLTDAEFMTLKADIAGGTPRSLGMEPPSDHWTHQLAKQWALQQFGKTISVRVLNECVPAFRPTDKPWVYERPQPPGPRDVRRLSPELAADPEFVAWYLSPMAAQLEQRSYEAAVRDWDARYTLDGKLRPNLKPLRRGRGRPKAEAKVAETVIPEPEVKSLQEMERELETMAQERPGLDWPKAEEWPLASDPMSGMAPLMTAPGQRTGKHAKSKGSNYTPPKRRKKR